MRTLLPGLLALIIFITAAFIHGPWSGREVSTAVLEARSAAIDRVPATIGEWTSQAATMDTKTLQMGEIAGYSSRLYTNRQGQSVSVLLLCGRPGPIAVHTPEICYAGSGFEQPRGPTKEVFTIPSASAGQNSDVFWVAHFEKTSPTQVDRLRILYAWNADGPWVASKNPRTDWASNPFLYKLYVVRHLAEEEELTDRDPAVALLHELLPELRKALFPPPSPH